MKKLLAGLLAMVGLVGPATAEAPKMIDPSTILFSMSTIANDMAPLEKVSEVAPSDLIFHEDEWRQVEFFDRSRLGEVQAKLIDLKAFATAHQQKVGWSNVYVRELTPAPVLRGKAALETLEGQLKVKAHGGAVIFTGASNVVGRVADGLSFPLGGGVALYGFSSEAGIPVLGAIVESGGDNQILVRAFQKLSASDHLILVDWRAQMVLTSVAEDGSIQTWRP